MNAAAQELPKDPERTREREAEAPKPSARRWFFAFGSWLRATTEEESQFVLA